MAAKEDVSRSPNGWTPKVHVRSPLVDMDGDEMTRVIWKAVKNRLVIPFFDIDIQYYDLGLPNRDKTEDGVTQAAVQAVLKHRVGVKCPTISVDSHRVKEYGLKKAWFSPNGTLRQAVGGTLFREPILIPSIPRAVPQWIKPIVLARHAYGDQYAGKDERIDEAGTLSMVFRPSSGGPPREVTVFDFPASGGVAMAQYNTTESITGFAVASFNYALQRGYPLYFCSKSSILTQYDGLFQSIFQEVYDHDFRARFEEKGIFYEHRLNDELLAHLYKIEGNVVIAMKNYDGDAQSDALAQAYGSCALMTSALVSGDGQTFVSEAAHGTVTKHYYAHLRGEKTSTNPIACIFAWTQALIKRGTLDSTPEVVSLAQAIEKATIDAVAKDAVFTKDIALLYKDDRRHKYVTTDEFLEAVQRNVLARINKA
ncbi:isocitrate dehydrogenase NADP-dependent [Biscogniauxia marginata]|nr:isocitrate dehydrogenase NADP-dependent [Biscogniauxia marginata]